VPLGKLLHATQLYEAVLNLLNFLLLFLYLRKKILDGEVFSLYVIKYPIIRYFTEFFRGDHPDGRLLTRGPSRYLKLSASQLFCIAGPVAGIGLYVFRTRVDSIER
jgi:prolipoprotein diacylglyceryltransferase